MKDKPTIAEAIILENQIVIMRSLAALLQTASAASLIGAGAERQRLETKARRTEEWLRYMQTGVVPGQEENR